MTCGPRRPSRPNRSGPRWLHLGIDASGEGGYAREPTAEECEQQQAALTEPTKGCDVADFEELVARGERPDNLDARPNLDRPRFDDDPKVLEHRFFGALEINAARVIDELVTSRPPVELADHARANGFRPGQLLKGKRAVRFAQFPAAQAVRSPDWRIAMAGRGAGESPAASPRAAPQLECLGLRRHGTVDAFQVTIRRPCHRRVRPRRLVPTAPSPQTSGES